MKILKFSFWRGSLCHIQQFCYRGHQTMLWCVSPQNDTCHGCSWTVWESPLKWWGRSRGGCTPPPQATFCQTVQRWPVVPCVPVDPWHLPGALWASNAALLLLPYCADPSTAYHTHILPLSITYAYTLGLDLRLWESHRLLRGPKNELVQCIVILYSLI